MIEFINDKFFDDRGSLFTIYNKEQCPIEFVQDRVSKSLKGTIRGFHGDSKTWKYLVCMSGKIKVVTYSCTSRVKKTYVLSSESDITLGVLIPPKILLAHQCLEDSILMYKWSHAYEGPDNQASVYWNDETIRPEWIKLHVSPIISDRDKNAKRILDDSLLLPWD
jgi:dTDP-4-dehydrorhamnose 3,5-epimerase